MRILAATALVCCLAAAPAVAGEGGLRLHTSDPLQITVNPGIEQSAQDDSAYLSEGGFLTGRVGHGFGLADSLVLQSLPAFEAEIVRSAGFSAGVSARTPHDRRGVFRNYDIGRTAPDGGLGAYGSYSLDDVTFTARLGQETTDGNGGFVADLGIKWASQIMENLRVVIGSEISWADENYFQGLYASDTRFAGTGLRLRDASPGLKDLTVSGALTYSIGDNWTVGGLIGAQRFLGNPEAGAAVGQDSEYFGGLSLGVRF